ncbi:uncharacterized protein LOC116424215 isoform X2 [Nomia melanderi]|uniref:uncharacterized protein LOC116424215 isoform X2 n=1 Tax=Nomia melanderi TaxID=2448451 RepID=UPI003FCE50F7
MEFASLLNWSQLYKLTIAIHRTMELFRLPENGKMIHLNDVFQQDLDIWSESPDLPWTAERYKTKEDIKHDPEAVGRMATGLKNNQV